MNKIDFDKAIGALDCKSGSINIVTSVDSYSKTPHALGLASINGVYDVYEVDERGVHESFGEYESEDDAYEALYGIIERKVRYRNYLIQKHSEQNKHPIEPMSSKLASLIAAVNDALLAPVALFHNNLMLMPKDLDLGVRAETNKTAEVMSKVLAELAVKALNLSKKATAASALSEEAETAKALNDVAAAAMNLSKEAIAVSALSKAWAAAMALGEEAKAERTMAEVFETAELLTKKAIELETKYEALSALKH